MAVTRKELDHKLLLELIDYNPQTGKFFWRKRTPETMGISDYNSNENWLSNIWNPRLEGKEALTGRTGKGYASGTILGKGVRAHRVAFFYMTGAWPTKQIDHINGIKTDNRWSNLREVDNQTNHRNKGLQSNNSSGYHGVCRTSDGKKWRAYIKVDGKQIPLGHFAELEGAKTARKEAEKLYGFHPNHGK